MRNGIHARSGCLDKIGGYAQTGQRKPLDEYASACTTSSARCGDREAFKPFAMLILVSSVVLL